MNSSKALSVRFLASRVGQVVSTLTVLGSVVCLKTIYLHECIDTRTLWNSRVYVNEHAISELKCWRNNVRILNSKGKCMSESKLVDVRIYTDVSVVGYGGYVEMNCPIEMTFNNENSMFH